LLVKKIAFNSTNYNMMLNSYTKLQATSRASSHTSQATNFVFFSPLLLAFSIALFAGVSNAAPADDFKEGSKLYQQGKLDQAMAKVTTGLQQQPKDAQGRFLKGLIQTEQKKTTDAIQTFTGLTEDYPELPEPYNNLAVLYAGQGNYEKAKAALELAIHTHPAYATAHENLGDIYAQLARRAYDKALLLDKSNTTALSKLALVKEMFSTPKSQQVAAVATPGVLPTPATVSNAKPEPAKPTVASTPIQPSAATDDSAKAAVLAWAKAWSARDVAGYLGAYAPTFETPDKLSRNAWEAQRKERIERQKSISVDVSIKSVKITGNEAVVVFRQAYRADTIKSDNTKTMRLVRVANRWMIQSERAGG
jgi:tetratricopeptide (TPR) repeat protein